LGFDERREQRLLAWAIAVVFILGLLAFIAKGADQPADPYLKPAPPGASVPAVTVPARTPVPGFGEVSFRVASGPELCALLAQTATQQARGLMARFAIDNRIERAEGLKAFDRDGYRFQPHLSSDEEWTFSRPQPPPVAETRLAQQRSKDA
jgi:hypothetical protein